MGLTRKSVLSLLLLIPLGIGLWRAHATAWDLGRRSPVLSFDAAQYALAARELAEHGRLATTFALPIELARHASPPWPLAVVQPGLVLAEAAAFRAFPPGASVPGAGALRDPVERERLTLVLPFLAYLALGCLLALATERLLAVGAAAPAGAPRARAAPAPAPARPGLGSFAPAVAGFVVGAAFLLDPEAQHFAVGGFTELPFTLGLTAALAALALGGASRWPLLFGLLLGVTGAFRGTMLAIAPLLAVAAALVPEDASPAGRARVVALILVGTALPLAPWWIYKARAFGSPGWDLSAIYAPWDGVAGQSWFSLSHLPAEPRLPRGLEALPMLVPKLGVNSQRLLSALVSGPRLLWIAALALWVTLARMPRSLKIAGAVVLAQALLTLLVAALGAAWMRYLFPARVPLEAAGVLAAWGLIAAAPATLSPRARRLLCAGVALVTLAWSIRQTALGLDEARATSRERGSPGVATMLDLAGRVAASVPDSEVVMSNLGPSLAWYARRPVLHLALTPGDMAACRARVEFRHVLLAFRDAAHAWPGWGEVIARPELAGLRPEWNVREARHWVSDDGFRIVWLDLGDAAPRAAPGGLPPAAAGAAPRAPATAP